MLGAVAFGMLAVVACLALCKLLLSAQATPIAALARTRSLILWTQPLIYLVTGLIVGEANRRSGPLYAPLVGLFLASFGWLVMRRQGGLASDPTVLGQMGATGVLFGLAGAITAPLLHRRAKALVCALILGGLLAFGWSLLNLGSVSGQAQQDRLDLAPDGTLRTETVAVPGARIVLLGARAGVELYATVSDEFGRFQITRVPSGRYSLRASVPPPGDGLAATELQVRGLLGGDTEPQTLTLTPEPPARNR